MTRAGRRLVLFGAQLVRLLAGGLWECFQAVTGHLGPSPWVFCAGGPWFSQTGLRPTTSVNQDRQMPAVVTRPARGVVHMASSHTPWSAEGPGAEPIVEGPPTEVSVAGPPLGWLGAAAATAVASVLLWLPGSLMLHGVGYVMSTFLTLGLLAGFKRLDLRARQSAFYSPREQLPALIVGVTAVAVAGAMAHVWVLATYWAG
jgi:hypothetical protein